MSFGAPLYQIAGLDLDSCGDVSSSLGNPKKQEEGEEELALLVPSGFSKKGQHRRGAVESSPAASSSACRRDLERRR